MELRSIARIKRSVKYEMERPAIERKKLKKGRPAAILTAPYDSLELVFDYISVKDLCSVGQTCQHLQ